MAEAVAIEASSPDPEYPESDLEVNCDFDALDFALGVLSSFDSAFFFCLQNFCATVGQNKI